MVNVALSISKVHRSCPTFCILAALSEDSTTAALAPYVGGATSLISSPPSIGDFTPAVQFIEATFVCSGGGHPVFFAVDLVILTTEVLEESGRPTWPATDFAFWADPTLPWPPCYVAGPCDSYSIGGTRYGSSSGGLRIWGCRSISPCPFRHLPRQSE